MVHTYHDVPPPPALRPYVQAFRVDRHTDPSAADRPCRILPDGGGHLLIQMYGEATETPRGMLDPDVIRLSLVGPRSVYKDIDLRRRLLTVAVELRPAGTAALLGAPVVDLIDRSASLSEVASGLAERLAIRLAQAASVEDTVDIVRTALRAVHDAASRPSARDGLTAAVAHMQSTRGRVAVQDVASAVGWSARHLRSVFAETVGLSPKRFARIVRIRHAVRRLQNPNPPGLAALALACGFCDQAHMTREFQALLGEPPAAFFQRLRTLAER